MANAEDSFPVFGPEGTNLRAHDVFEPTLKSWACDERCHPNSEYVQLASSPCRSVTEASCITSYDSPCQNHAQNHSRFMLEQEGVHLTVDVDAGGILRDFHVSGLRLFSRFCAPSHVSKVKRVRRRGV